MSLMIVGHGKGAIDTLKFVVEWLFAFEFQALLALVGKQLLGSGSQQKSVP